jgi:hypothetical protein
VPESNFLALQLTLAESAKNSGSALATVAEIAQEQL